jgi:hypothetical protein
MQNDFASAYTHWTEVAEWFLKTPSLSNVDVIRLPVFAFSLVHKKYKIISTYQHLTLGIFSVHIQCKDRALLLPWSLYSGNTSLTNTSTISGSN